MDARTPGRFRLLRRHNIYKSKECYLLYFVNRLPLVYLKR